MDTFNDAFVKGKFNEQEIEYAIIDLYQQAGGDERVGWWYQDGETMHRRYDDVLLEDRLKDSLRVRYASSSTSPRSPSTRALGRRTGSSMRVLRSSARILASRQSTSST